MIELKQSTASQEIPLGYFLDSTDGDTAETGLTIANTDIKIWKTGATTLANKNSGGATHISGGIYYCVLDATDTDTLGPLVVFVHESGALTVRVECAVLPANVYDSRFSTDKLQVDAVEISGDSTAADNLESACDNYSVTRGLAGTALPAAAADAAGGLPISDAGGLDLDGMDTDIDSILTDTGTTLDGKIDTIDTNVDAILVDTGATLDGKIDTIDGIVDAILVDTAVIGAAGAGLTDLGGMSAAMKAEVNAEALDVLVTDTHAEPAGVPAATSSIKDKLSWLFTLARNKGTQTAATKTLRNDADGADIGTSSVSDDGTTFTRGEWS